MKNYLFIVLLIVSVTGCTDHEPIQQQLPDKKVSFTSLDKEQELDAIIKSLGFVSSDDPRKLRNARIAGVPAIETDSIMKVLQPDSVHFGYSFQVMDSERGFRNLVLKQRSNDYLGFIMEYDMEEQNPFTGVVRRFDLQGNLLGEAAFENGQVKAKSESGRVSDCSEAFRFAYLDNFGDACTNVWDVIDDGCYLTLLIEECSGGGSGAGGSGGTGGGSPGGTTPGTGGIGSGGTPINPGGDPWGGGGGGGGSSGGSGGSSGGSGGGSGGSGGSGSGSQGPGYEGTPGNEVIGIVRPKKKVKTIEEQLEDLLENDPTALIEIDCSQLPNWQAVAQHTPPQSIKDKIKNLDDNYTSILSGDWDIQYIDDASSPIVNLDYYPVRISQLPKNPETGRQFTAEDFYHYVRKNLASFFNDNTTDFEPYNAYEAAIWNSNNYLGAIMRFDIWVFLANSIPATQDGSVICSYAETTTWRFTTIESPKDWSHPVSGTREFGLTTNSDGTYSFYARGVDRVAEGFDDFMGKIPFTDTAYDGGDALWTKFQENLEAFVNDPVNGGVAQKQDKIIARPDWEKVKEVLRGNRPISDLGCK